MTKARDIDVRDAFFDEVYNIAQGDRSVIFMAADVDAFSLEKYRKNLPDQFINAGVAEQNMIAVATGLALSGKKVFVYAIIPFATMRCYEQIKANICSMNVPVTIVGAGAGLSFGYDGPTHHAVSDVAIMRALPEMTIFNPSDPATASASARMAHQNGSPSYVRIDKGVFPVLYSDDEDFSSGAAMLREGGDICIVATGTMTHRALEVAEEVEAERGISVSVIDVYRVKPVDGKLLLGMLGDCKRVVTLEENTIVGGLGNIMSEILADNGKDVLLKRIALPDEQSFAYGSREYLHKVGKIDKDSIVKEILAWAK